MREIVGGIVGFVIVGGLFWALERRFPARAPKPLLARGRLTDLLHVLFTSRLGSWLGNAALVVAFFAALPTMATMRLGTFHPSEPFGAFARLSPIVQMPLALVALDFFGYWAHRALHGRALFRFHAVHHAPADLDWLSAARNHPVAEAASRVIGGIPLVMVGVDPRVLACLAPVLLVWAVLLHANVRFSAPWMRRFAWLRYVIATPRFHRWHHADEPQAHDKNFAALLPIWDLLFGTFYLPEREPLRLGVSSERVPDGFVAQMLHPFRRRSRSKTSGQPSPASGASAFGAMSGVGPAASGSIGAGP